MKQHPQRPDIAARIGDPAAQDFGSHVRRSAGELGRLCLCRLEHRGVVWIGGAARGDAKVHELHVACRSDDDIGRFDVAMDDAVLMRMVEGVRQLGAPARGRFRIETIRGEPMRQLDSRHELHHDERVAIELADVVDGADVGMAQFRDGPGFAQKAIACRRRPRRILPEDFDRDLASKPRVTRAIHDAHTARAERFHDFVMTESACSHVWQAVILAPVTAKT